MARVQQTKAMELGSKKRPMIIEEEYDRAMKTIEARTRKSVEASNKRIEEIRKKDMLALKEWDAMCVKPEVTSVIQPEGPSFNNPCYRCGGEDHHQRKCPKPMYCYECGDPNHIRPTCPWRSQQRRADWKADWTHDQRTRFRKWLRARKQGDSGSAFTLVRQPTPAEGTSGI